MSDCWDYLNPVRWFCDSAEENERDPHKRVHLCSGCLSEGHNIRTCADVKAQGVRITELEAQLARSEARGATLRRDNQALHDECARLRSRLAYLVGEAAAVHSKSWR
jgi:hypothetical protein